VHVLARIANLLGPGRDADMTIYRTKVGGLVFAAGAFTMPDASERPDISRIIENLWTHMTNRA
jgi:hypothetical protein